LRELLLGIVVLAHGRFLGAVISNTQGVHDLPQEGLLAPQLLDYLEALKVHSEPEDDQEILLEVTLRLLRLLLEQE
jgi:hypothetical protein